MLRNKSVKLAPFGAKFEHWTRNSLEKFSEMLYDKGEISAC